jgi:glycolate oxidase FAD binding subunit
LAEILRPSPNPSPNLLPGGEGFIDSIPVPKVIKPESIDQLAEAIRAERGAVVPLGAQMHTNIGNPLRRADCAVDLTGLRRITAYNPADLTIHVEAGVTLRQIQNALLENNQYLPLDPWSGAEATIGGIAAVNAQGPFRAVGTIRDWIIGMKVVDINGQITKAGGRVVKNVTGYDLHKLYTGSLGTLAVVAEVSLKLRAKFKRMATAIAQPGNADAAVQLISSIRKTALQPVSCVWVGPKNEVWIRLAEDPGAVEWQLKHLPTADWRILEGNEETTAWEKLRSGYGDLKPIVLRVIGLPATVHEIIKEYRPAAWIAHASNGIVLVQVSSSADIRRIRDRYRAVIEKAPLEVRREVATFGLNDAEYTFMKKMKDAFDPEGRLNPGRHVDGERRQ